VGFVAVSLGASREWQASQPQPSTPSSRVGLGGGCDVNSTPPTLERFSSDATRPALRVAVPAAS
jgi:hypothetical protein